MLVPADRPVRELAALQQSAREALGDPEGGKSVGAASVLRRRIEQGPTGSVAARRSAAAPGAPAIAAPAVHPAREPESGKVLRFRRSERLVHWAIAIPFLTCFTTAVVLVALYNLHPERPYRSLVSWAHRVSGICFIIFPMLAVVRCRGDLRVYFHNVRQAWVWTLDDFRWLSRMGLAAISSKVSLPEQGKFNAAEKLNFMMVMTTYPLFILTGVLIWMPGIAFFSWLAHFLMAVIATPLLLGHLFMATLNPSTRVGLQGMISGFVDRQWAKHHYRRWYRENFEGDTVASAHHGNAARGPAHSGRGTARRSVAGSPSAPIPEP